MHEIFEVMNWIGDLVWSWHVKWMRWLVIKVAWFWHKKWFYIDWWKYDVGLVRT